MFGKAFFRRKHGATLFAFLFLAVLGAGYQNFILPEKPSRNIDTKTVQLVNGKYLPTSNILHVTEYSRDGRLSLHWRPASTGPMLSLARPERVQDYLYSKKNPIMGSGLVNQGYDAIIDVVNAHLPNKNKLIGSDLKFGGRVMLCEKTSTNPFVCDGNKDCYNITIVVRYAKDLGNGLIRYRMVANDVEIKVRNPKTVQAAIDSVKVDTGASMKVGPIFEYPILAEPTIAGDGRLLVTRLARAKLKLTDGITEKKDIDMVYSVYPESYGPCDVTKWTKFLPISHAHFDKVNKMSKRYKFARYQIRDSLGNLVENGEDFGGTYPWMDRHAANIFFTSFGYNSFYSFNKQTKRVETPFDEMRGSSKYGSSDYFNLDDVVNEEEFSKKKALLESGGNLAGVSVAGFWTHGKVVLLDGLINNSDFTFRISDRIVDKNFNVDREKGGHRINVERNLKLYRGSDYESTGSVREKGGDLIDYTNYLTPNSTFIGSVENRLNHNKSMMPVTPGDVVWHLGTSRHTEEVVFDDYNSLYMLINANMTAPLEKGYRTMRHLAGYYAGLEAPQVSGFPRTIKTGYPALIQNSGTAPDSFMTLPYYGKIDLKYSRIEPIAKGGIYGKGLWLENQGSLQFQIPPQTGASFSIAKNKDWYVGVFFDARRSTSDNETVDFLSLGKSEIKLKRSRNGTHLVDRILFLKNGKEVGSRVLPGGLVPWEDRWSHFGFSFSANQAPEVFFNGLSIGRAEGVGGNASKVYNFINLAAGSNIYLGNSPESSFSGMRGWYDEFKVIARTPTYEEACNYARGTLIALSLKPSDDQVVYNQSLRYPASTHQAIAKAIYEQNPNRKFACHNRYYRGSSKEVLYAEDHTHFKNLPLGSKSIREEMLGTKNMLIYGKSRPDFSGNKFCLSCHLPEQKFDEMNLKALTRKPGLRMQADVRRQPMQPDRFFRGVIPANYFSPGQPARRVASNSTDVDQFLNPALDKITVRWTQLGPKYRYSIDVRDASSGKEVPVGGCISNKVLKNANSYLITGKCVSQKNYEFPMSHQARMRVCYTNHATEWVNVKCSLYTPLNLHTQGVLDIYLEP